MVESWTRKTEPEVRDTLRSSDLQPGDVLLSRGSTRLGSRISDWICALDGGSYSHASIWDGREVIEASGAAGKIRGSGIETLVVEHEYVHAYRFARDGLTLDALGLSADAITSRARSFVGSSYPYAELCLLGTLIGLGRATGLPLAQELVRRFGSGLADMLRLGEGAPGEGRPMTCSQLVSEVFWQADPAARRYALVVPYEPSEPLRDLEVPERCSTLDAPTYALLGVDDSVALDSEDYERLAALERDCQRVLGIDAPPSTWRRDPARGFRGARAIGVEPRHVVAGDRALPSRCVTPRDLQRSLTLRCIGSIAL